MDKQSGSIWTKKFVVFLIMVAFYFMNNYMLNPVLAGYTAELGGASNVIGLVSGAMSGVALFLTPVVGPLVDRYNRKLLTIVSFALLVVANLISSFAGNASVLLGARIVQGIGFAFASVILSTTVSTMFDDSRVGKAIGIYAATQALAQVVAPSAGIIIRDASGCRVGYLVATAFTAICFVMALCTKGFGFKPKQPRRTSLSLNSILAVNGIPFALTSAVCGFLLQIVQAYVDPFATLTGHTAGISLFFTVYAVTMLLSRFAFSGLMDKKSLGSFILLCSPMTALAFYLLQIQQNQWVLWTGGILCAIGLGTMQIVAQVWLVKSVPSERRGVASSTYYIAMNLGHTLGGYLGGIWLGGEGAGNFFYYSTALALIPLFFTFAFRRRYFVPVAHS